MKNSHFSISHLYVLECKLLFLHLLNHASSSDLRSLLTNARLIDPATNHEGRGAVLVRDGIIADVAWGAAPEAPEVAQIDRLRRPRRSARPDRHARLRRRAGRRASRNPEERRAKPRRRAASRRCVCMPDTNPVIDDPAIVDFVLRRARDTAIVRSAPPRP